VADVYLWLVLDFFGHVPAGLEFLILLAGAVGALYSLHKYVWKPIRAFSQKLNRGMDTLLGYAPVLDPATGRVIQPETPALANRVYELEMSNGKIADALTTLVKVQADVVELEKKWQKRESDGMKIICEWTDWRQQHEAEAQQREERLAEWEAWRQDQNVMMESLQNVHEDPHKNL
jgi:hypothetical protein